MFHKNAEAAKVLIASKVNVNIADVEGMTPLHHAVWTRDGDIINSLLNAGVATDTEEKHGRTVLILLAGPSSRRHMTAAS